MYVLLAAAVCAAAVAAFSLSELKGYQVLWQIGEFDGSAAEFALAPDGARRFTDRFPEDPVFKVGESRADQWPFIHPNEADTAWGGAAHHTFRIQFPLTAVPHRPVALIVALADVHERLAPELVVSVNGHEHRRRLRPGAGRAYYGDFAHTAPQTIWLPIPADQLKPGANEIAISLRGGSWVAYDALALVERAVTPPQRRPDFQPHAFVLQITPLHETFSGLPRGWQGDMMVVAGEAGWVYLMGAADQTLTLSPKLPPGHFITSLDVYPVQGQMRLELSIDDPAAPYWQVAWDEEHIWLVGGDRKESPGPGPWRVEVISSATETFLRLRSLQRSWAVETMPVRHSPRAEGRLRIRVTSRVAQAFLTNISWTAPIQARATLQTQPAGRKAVEVALRAPAGRADAAVRVRALRAAEAVRSQTVHWRGDQEDVSLKLWLPRETPSCDRVRFEYKAPRKRQAAVEFEAPLTTDVRPEPVPPRPAGAYIVETAEGTVLGNAAYEILLPTDQALGPSRLIERRSGRVLADQPYCYEFAGQPAAIVAREVEREASGAVAANITVRAGSVTAHHRIVFPPDRGGFAERFFFEVTGDAAVDLTKWRAGWVRRCEDLADGEEAGVFMPVPWRRDTHASGELLDLTPLQALWQTGWYRADGTPRRVRVPQHGSEGWLWHGATGGTLILKYNPHFMEWTLIDRVGRAGELMLRFGGCGAWHGDPQRWQSLPPGTEAACGWTFFIAYAGDWRQGFYAFREFMERHGHGCPASFDPPVHWNELYDNPLWWGPDTPERRAKYYRLEDMLVEAEKAHAAGCQALYLDPGWDTVFGSHIWAEDRLGPVDEFVRLMREHYDLAVSLHTPMADWASGGGGGRTYPPEAWRVDEHGRVLEGRLCSGARAYIEEEARRLIRLADAGVVYFMFDGSRYTGPCFAKDHGHPIPYTHDDHIAALHQIAQLVHQKHPEVIIEQHDQIVAGVHSVYAPVYIGHGDGGWDERWANEYMWHPLRDLKEGRARSLYYYNLAYSLPQYLHIDLRDDNDHCLALWWYASTCRHLGIGGTHPDGRNWLQVQRAMAKYRRLQDFFKRGIFYGLDEETHVHVLRGRGVVICAFNLSSRPKEWQCEVDLTQLGLVTSGTKIRPRVHGAESSRRGHAIRLRADLAPWDVRVVQIAL